MIWGSKLWNEVIEIRKTQNFESVIDWKGNIYNMEIKLFLKDSH